ncbi:ImmA/IrrE family metallo-endopeptidase [Corynebacterium urealyticum]|uniref:ImmA/IrrE family metallo-endopeptidase n=1 Tax=Corynebacterium urealyticum TaxID=43771 RepID=UPI0011E657F7|nr:ImmA/IrrE family metallo-endopeptidase [Corynebacterium urealyticum]TYR17777.1 ImmA/IrrE family metallo-endopeptidase [Corynebacterium urealyticum]
MTSSNETQAKKAAQEFRTAHGLGVQPLGDLVGLVERFTGYDVAVVDADADEHGLTMFDPVREHILIGVARTRHPMRQRSTLAHELGHVIFEDFRENLQGSPVGGGPRRPAEEIRADAFARHLLIPQEGLKAWLEAEEPVSEVTLSRVVQRYLVSPAIAAIALRDTGYINSDLTENWQQISTGALATKYGWRDYYHGLQEESDRIRAPQKLLARATKGYIEGVVSAQTIATLRGIPEADLLAEFAEAGIAPKPQPDDEFEIQHLPPVNVDLSGLE